MPASPHERPLVVDTSPVSGLPRRRLPFVPVFAQSVAAIAPAGTAGVTPALVIGAAGGGGAFVAFVCAALVTVLVSACIRPMAQRMASVGGLYSYVARGLGPKVAVPTGWSAIVGYSAVAMAGLIAVGAYLAHVAVSIGLADDTPTAAIVVIACIAALTASLVMIRGIRMSAWVTLAVECVSIAMVLGILALLATTHRSGEPIEPALRWDGDFQTLAVGVVVAVSAFVGFESSTALSGEAQQPFLSIPRTIRWTPVAAAAIYLIAVPVQAVALYAAPESVRSSSTPLVELLLSQDSAILAAVLDAGIAASFFACTLASVNALVRVLFCMGREGVAPAGFGRLHARYSTPAFAIGTAMVVVTAVPVIALLLGASPEDGLRMFLTLSACGYLGSYLAACIAAPVLLRRIGESSAYVWVIGTVTTVALLFLAVNATVSTVRDGNRMIVVYGAILVLAAIYTAVLGVALPERLRAVGIYDETQRADLLRAPTFR
ncbi:APC family permease [Antrihabitans sp. YC2-6]|uniref:APC family permease n=1 Tax=Antrihabitans sp. YC2-6 TaxID=2799498 RepID=UPI0018F3B207|nr:APC family permease [Antrihabitans sp. YC2-6]MBJ8343796.1 APC family permease [Antrihabitans sp. YC2-6]